MYVKVLESIQTPNPLNDPFKYKDDTHLMVCSFGVQCLYNIQSSAISLETLCEVAQVKVDFAQFSQGVLII